MRSTLIYMNVALALAVVSTVGVARGQQASPRAALAKITDAEAVELALAEVSKASLGEDAALRANAIEALVPTPGRALPVIQRGVADENRGVRFTAAVAAGLIKQKNLSPTIAPLREDESANVRAAAIFALAAMGEKVDLTPMAEMLESDDAALRSNVAMLLGLLGDKSAIPMLKRAAQKPMPRAHPGVAAVTRIQIAEAIAKLGDDDALQVLRAGLYSTWGEVQVVSLMALGDVNDQRMSPGLTQFLERTEVEVRLAAARTLAKLGDQTGLKVALKETTNEDPRFRSMAAAALREFDREKAMPALHDLVRDPDASVRISAAASVIKHLAR